MLEFQLPWDSQPQEAAEVNRSVREPSVLLVPSVGLGNLATPGDLANVLNRAGVGPDGQYTDVRALVSTDSSLSSTSFSWYALFDTPSSLSTLECVLGRGLDSGTNNTGFGFHGKHTNAAYAGAFYVGSGYTIIGKPTGGALATDTRYSIGGTYDGTNGRGYHNGVKTVGPTAGTAPNTTARLVLNSTSQTADPSETSGLYKFYAVLYWPFALSDAEMAEVHNRLWAYAFAPQTIPVPVSAGGGTVTLAAQDVAHAHALDNAALSIGVTLTVADLAHGHALDASTLSTGTALAVADSLHAHALDNVTLSTTGAVSLTVADLLHAHTLDAVVLTSQTDLAAADMAHGHALDGVTLTLGGISLVIAEIMHAHALDNVALTLDTYLAVADILHAHTIDNVLVSIPGGTLDLILKILVNRQELNPATGTFTLYDDDGVTVLYTTSAWADAAGTVPYSGGALRRIDALI